MPKGMTYEDAGIDYSEMDTFKVAAQKSAAGTAFMLKRFGFSEVPGTRGESCYLVDLGDFYLGLTEEGLGTKNIVAEESYQIWLAKKISQQICCQGFFNVAQCAVAAITNDMATVGVLPVVVAMHLAVGASEWFKDEKRAEALTEGWHEACLIVGCAWGPGETPTLKEIVNPEHFVLSGSGVGIIKPKDSIIKPNIQDGDSMIFLESSGIHANGLTLARRIAKNLTEGYTTIVDRGKTYGELLLEPTKLYTPVIEDCIKQGIKIHYAVNITGHGFRKLMRAVEPFVYVIDELPEPMQIFDFIQRQGNIADKEMYSTFNMGAGFALYVRQADVEKVIQISRGFNLKAWVAGHIEKKGDEKKVIVPSLNITFAADSMNIR